MLAKIRLLLMLARGKSPALVLVEAVKAVAEGKFGPGAAKVYWAVAGYKTWATVVLTIAWTALWLLSDAHLCAECHVWANYVGLAAAGLASVGLWDASIRAEPPTRPSRLK